MLLETFQTLIVFAAFYVCLSPAWETNDDVGMSMWAHGYGEALSPTPGLVYSNVLWGFLLSKSPTILGVLPYTWAHIVLLVISLTAIIHVMRRFSVPPLLTFLVATLSLARPALFLQFTTLSGMLAVAGMLLYLAFCHFKQYAYVVTGNCFLFLSFLVRPEALAVVVMIALPMIVYINLTANRAFLLGVFGIAAIVASAYTIDNAYYSDNEWQHFRAFSAARAFLMDFPVQRMIGRFSEALSDVGWSANDFRMFLHWFHADPKLANVGTLWTLINYGEFENVLSIGANDGLLGLNDVIGVQVLALSSVAALLLLNGLSSPHRSRLLASGLSLLAFLFLFGFLGRPSQVRIYYAPLVLIVVGAFCLTYVNAAPIRRRIITCATIVGTAWALWVFVPLSIKQTEMAKKARQDVAKLTEGEFYVIWGSSFPYETAYPPLADARKFRKLRFYSLGATGLAPPLLEHFNGNKRGLIDMLLGDAPVPFIATQNQIDMLAVYCDENHQRTLETLGKQKYATFEVYFVRCI